jgi:hypothetical protein
MRRKERLLLLAGITVLVLVLLAWFGWPFASSTFQREVIANSSVVLCDLSINAEWQSISIILSSERGTQTAIVRLTQWSGKAEYKVPIEGEAYIRLWRTLTENGIWELPSGEYWPYFDQMENLENIFPEVKLAGEDYRRNMVDSSTTGIKIQLGKRRYGFMRYDVDGLKDQRYAKIISAVFDFVDLRKVIEHWRQDQRR